MTSHDKQLTSHGTLPPMIAPPPPVVKKFAYHSTPHPALSKPISIISFLGCESGGNPLGSDLVMEKRDKLISRIKGGGSGRLLLFSQKVLKEKMHCSGSIKMVEKRDELISWKIYPCDHLVLHQGMALYY